MHKAEVCPALSTAVAPYDGVECERTYRVNHSVNVAWIAKGRLQTVQDEGRGPSPTEAKSKDKGT